MLEHHNIMNNSFLCFHYSIYMSVLNVLASN